jgi:CDP-glycerol glycerophosphotransferase
MFDYLLLDRPIILFRPDHQEYITRSRTLYDDKLDVKPGPLVASVNELLLALRNKAAETPAHARHRQALRDKLHDHADGKAGERFNELLLDELGLALETDE